MSDLKTKKPFVIGITGGTGSGKTALAKALQLEIGLDKSLLFQLDAYYQDLSDISLDQRNKINFDHPNALHLRMFAEHLGYLKESKPIKKPVYDFTTHTRFEHVEHIEPKSVIITEGILLFYDEEIRGSLDFKIFLDIDSEARFNRRLRRDIEERGRTPEALKMQYYTTVEPMYGKFVGPSKQYADLILRDGKISDWTYKILSELDYQGVRYGNVYCNR